MIRAAIITSVIAPYRIPVFNCLAKDGRLDLDVVFLAETGDRREWRVDPQEFKFRYVTLSGHIVGRAYQDFPLYLNPSILGHLWRGDYDVIMCGGYDHPSFWLAILYARFFRKGLVLWSESTQLDLRRGDFLRAAFKRVLIKQFATFAVPGVAAYRYLRDMAVPSALIATAPNAVDNDSFANGVKSFSTNKEQLKCKLGITGTVVAYVGRLIDAKGVLDLLRALEMLNAKEQVCLLLIGDGPDKAKYEQEVTSRQLNARFFGFQQQQQLPSFYAIADIFVFPTYSDPWGLVVNEAMSSGLPILASTAAGAVEDLVYPGRNGYLFSPGDIKSLTHYLALLVDDPELACSMGRQSVEIIQHYSPQDCANGLATAIVDAFKARQG